MTKVAALFAGVPGTINRVSSGRPAATRTPPTFAATTSASASRGRSHCARGISPLPASTLLILSIGREECFEEMLTYTQEKNIHVRLKSAVQQPIV